MRILPVGIVRASDDSCNNATDNRDWGYDRIAGALANLGDAVSDQTVGHILTRHGIPPAPARKHTTTWKDFIRAHQEVLAATDFFTTEVWTARGLVTYYVVFVIHVATRRVQIAGVTPFPDERWMTQVARNLTMADVGGLANHRSLIHDRDGKYCPAFDEAVRDGGVRPVRLPPRRPNLNAYAERWVRSVKDDCLGEADSGRRTGATNRVARVRRTLPRRAEPPREGHPPPLSVRGDGPARARAMPRASRGPPEVLLPTGRMSFLTTRPSRWTCNATRCRSRASPPSRQL